MFLSFDCHPARQYAVGERVLYRFALEDRPERVRGDGRFVSIHFRTMPAGSPNCRGPLQAEKRNDGRRTSPFGQRRSLSIIDVVIAWTANRGPSINAARFKWMSIRKKQFCHTKCLNSTSLNVEMMASRQIGGPHAMMRFAQHNLVSQRVEE